MKVARLLIFIFFCVFAVIFMKFEFFYQKKAIDCRSNWAICSINKQTNSTSHTKREIKIAIIDSGIDDKKAQVNIVKRFSNKHELKDTYGHGTAIASIIASKESNSIEGIYPEALIYDVNILDENGNTSIDEVIKAVEWCISQKVDIINMSFGIENDDIRLYETIKKAINNDIIIVSAAGNTLGMYTEYPAKYEEVLSISAVDKEMNLFKYAAKGKVDFVAPGVDIEAIKIGNLSNQKKLSGTSFATAYATGIIATLLSENKINKENYRKTLLEYADPIKEDRCDASYGCGFLKLQ